MKIKTRLTLGVGLLFGMIVLLSLLGAFSINALKRDTQSILAANYNTLEYSRNMLLALDGNISDPAANDRFRRNLAQQQKNITWTNRSDYEDMANILSKAFSKNYENYCKINSHN